MTGQTDGSMGKRNCKRLIRTCDLVGWKHERYDMHAVQFRNVGRGDLGEGNLLYPSSSGWQVCILQADSPNSQVGKLSSPRGSSMPLHLAVSCGIPACQNAEVLWQKWNRLSVECLAPHRRCIAKVEVAMSNLSASLPSRVRL